MSFFIQREKYPLLSPIIIFSSFSSILYYLLPIMWSQSQCYISRFLSWQHLTFGACHLLLCNKPPPIHRGLKHQFCIVINVSAGQPGVSKSGPHCKLSVGQRCIPYSSHLRQTSEPARACFYERSTGGQAECISTFQAWPKQVTKSQSKPTSRVGEEYITSNGRNYKVTPKSLDKERDEQTIIQSYRNQNCVVLA